MRNHLETIFWKNALHSLPAHLRPRYAHHIAAAERWELRFDAIVELVSRVKNRVSGQRVTRPRTA
jgi:hypothetical protein